MTEGTGDRSVAAGGTARAPKGSSRTGAAGLPMVIDSSRRYVELLGWLLADIWSQARGMVVAVYGLDVLGMATMAGAYGLGFQLLGRVHQRGGPVRVWGHDLTVLSAIGIAAGLILLALLIHSAARLVSHRMALRLAVRYEAASVIRLWEKIRELRAGGMTFDEPAFRKLHRMVLMNGRALGRSARLSVMAISGALMALFYGGMAVHSAPRTALIFVVVGLGVFGFMIRNNQRAASANRRMRENQLQTRVAMADLFRTCQSGDEAKADEQLRALYHTGTAARAAEAYSEQLYRVYQSQFLMAAAAAFAIASAVLLPLLEKPTGGAAVPVAMTAAGLVLLKMAFAFAGSVAGNLTRLNLRYQVLTEHWTFLKTGRLPRMAESQELQDGSEEED